MNEFFFNLLNNLDKLAGLKQLDKIYASHDNTKEGKEAAKAEIKILLGVLCNVSKQFPFIPDHEQQKIITQAVITEEFHSLNGNTVYKWLVRHKDKYFKEGHHAEDTKPQAEPLTGEARQAKLKEWMASLANAQQMIISNRTSRIDYAKEGKEWASEVERKAVSVGHKKADLKKLEAHELHLQYIKENYDPYTGKPLPTWIPETEWLEKQKN